MGEHSSQRPKLPNAPVLWDPASCRRMHAALTQTKASPIIRRDPVRDHEANRRGGCLLEAPGKAHTKTH